MRRRRSCWTCIGMPTFRKGICTKADIVAVGKEGIWILGSSTIPRKRERDLATTWSAKQSHERSARVVRQCIVWAQTARVVRQCIVWAQTAACSVCVTARLTLWNSLQSVWRHRTGNVLRVQAGVTPTLSELEAAYWSTHRRLVFVCRLSS